MSDIHSHGNVFLIGPMGVGKSTIGKVLAEQLGLQFYDSDREIEAATGADIPWIFDVEGEAGFRVREAKMIDELTAMHGIVLATGGGSVLSEANQERLKSRGVVVYLRASLNQQYERTSRDKNRPLLQTSDPEKKIRELMKIREPLYKALADITVNTSRRSPKSVSSEIVESLRAFREQQPAVEMF
ncbi:MAG: hypothetical protein RLZZ385_2514 [Pseudomonadota bacterium]